MIRTLLICLLTCICILITKASLFAQCEGLSADTLGWETFESGMPSYWKSPNGSDGASWRIDDGSIGYYLNAGDGKWLYINDEDGNQAGEAFFETESYDFSEYSGFLQLEFDLTFQDFADSGFMTIEVFHEGVWFLLMEESDDFFGHISIDIQAFAGADTRFRFSYNDEKSWGWGMGIDNFLITGREDLCGNNRCDYGESSESCPGDCPQVEASASTWIEIDRNLYGDEVEYTRFNSATSCDDCTEEVELGFPFVFYEDEFTSAFLNTNGNLSFGESFLAFTPSAFCLEGPKMIAPFFADIDLQGAGSMWYYADPDGHYFIATWKAVSYFGCGKDCEQQNTFQAILTDGSIRHIGTKILPEATTVVFQYQDMQWTTGNSSEGSRGFGGKPATVGLNQGNGETCASYGTFDQPGYGYYGETEGLTCLNNGVNHLDFRTLTFHGATGTYAVPKGELILRVSKDEMRNIIQLETDEIDGIDFFVVERSQDGINFEELTTIEAVTATNSIPGLYEYVDANPFEGVNHYRVLEIRSDGALEYSEIQQLARVPAYTRLEGAKFALTQVGPNPFKDHLNFSFDSPTGEPVKYMLVDMSGRVHSQGVLQAQEGINAMRLELADLPTAMYVLTIYQGKEKDYRQLVKN